MREICTSGSTRGRLMSDLAGMVRGSRVRRNVRSPNGTVHQRSTLPGSSLQPIGPRTLPVRKSGYDNWLYDRIVIVDV
jgi:hypothetical protein